MKDGFALSIDLPATPEEVYRAWLSSRGHSAMTGSKAHVQGRVGSKFDAWDGYITGTNLQLKPNSKIVQTWRTSEFAEDDADSKVEVQLEPTAIGTKLTLTHTAIPKGQLESYRTGWEEWYFKPMLEYFTK